MVRLRVIVEGQTEESFVNGPLRSYLAVRNVFVSATLLGRRAGDVTYQRVKRDVVLTLKQDHAVVCTTLFDFYGLGRGFPIVPQVVGQSPHDAVAFLEAALRADLAREIPDQRPELRFLPYIQLHEFEALLFSDPSLLAEEMFRPELAVRLQVIRNQFGTPEDINDSPHTAPSKRIMALHGGYEKVISGTLAAERIGIERMMTECPRFREWVNRLSALGVE